MASRIVIAGGVARGVYDDRLVPIYEALGIPRVERATDVEATESGAGIRWIARERKTGHIIDSGPRRQHVIDSEVAYLEANL